MSKFSRAAIVSALFFTAAVPSTAFAVPVCHPVMISADGAGAGAGVTGGFLGLVAALDLYDLIRRTTCSGDFLGLGGPGFTSPITPGMNVLPPQCVSVVKHHRHRKH